MHTQTLVYLNNHLYSATVIQVPKDNQWVLHNLTKTSGHATSSQTRAALYFGNGYNPPPVNSLSNIFTAI